MPVTRFGPVVPLLNSGLGNNISTLPSSGLAGQVITSNGSNGDYWGENIARITANGSNANPLVGPFVNFSAGSNIVFSWASNSLTIASTAAGAGGGGTTITTKDEGSTLSSSVTTLDFVGAGVTASGAGATTTVTIAGGGSATDPIAALFGAPTTAFEFDTSSLAGLTALGSPATENANTTVPGSYYLKDATSTTAWQGRYVASPSHPFTAVAKVTGSNMRANYNGVALFVGTSTPGKMICVDIGIKTRTVGVDIFTNPTTYGSTPASDITNEVAFSCYLGLVTVSTTSVSYYFSMDGYVWMPILTAHDGSLTIGSVGIAAKAENSGGHAAAFDFFRVWNSSKTFPG